MQNDRGNVIPFPTGGRRGAANAGHQLFSARDLKAVFDAAPIVSGASSWYHEEALRELDSKRKR